MRARHSAAILHTIGLGDIVGVTDEDYVQQAILLTNHPELRAQAWARTEAGAAQAFNGDAAVEGLHAALVAATGRG